MVLVLWETNLYQIKLNQLTRRAQTQCQVKTINQPSPTIRTPNLMRNNLLPTLLPTT